MIVYDYLSIPLTILVSSCYNIDMVVILELYYK